MSKRKSLPARSNSRSSHIHHAAINLAIADAKAELEAPSPSRSQPVQKTAPSLLSEGELAVERHRVAALNNVTHGLKEQALALPCDEHDAAAGEFCFASGRAVCAARMEAGKARWAATATPYRRPLDEGELAPLAIETRMGQRDARIRERERKAFIQRTQGRNMYRL